MTPEIKQRIQQIRQGKVPKGYKKTKDGIIPNNWQSKKLGTITHVFSSARVHKDEWTNDGIPFLRSSDVVSYFKGETNTRGNAYISNELYERLSAKSGKICKDDILITGGGTIGIPYLVRTDSPIYIKDADLICIQNSLSYNSKFIYYYFSSPKFHNYLKNISHGVTISHYTIIQVQETPIPLPPLPEQTAIAEILSTQDRVIELKEQLLAEKKRQKKYLMQQLLTGKKRLKGFKGEWKKCRLGEVFSERNETNCIDLPLLSITGDKGVIPQSDSEKRDTSNDDKSKYKRICPNDIGYNTMRMWQGRSALSKIEGIVSPAYTIVVPKYNIDAHYMSELLHQPDVVYKFWTHSQGLVSDTLTCKYNDFCKVWVRIPSLPEQTAIAEILSTADREIELLGQSIEAEKQKKKSLMQLLLTGIVRVK